MYIIDKTDKSNILYFSELKVGDVFKLNAEDKLCMKINKKITDDNAFDFQSNSSVHIPMGAKVTLFSCELIIHENGWKLTV